MLDWFATIPRLGCAAQVSLCAEPSIGRRCLWLDRSIDSTQSSMTGLSSVRWSPGRDLDHRGEYGA